MPTGSSRTILVAAVVVGALAGGGLALALVGPAAPGTAPGQVQAADGGPGSAAAGDVASVSQFDNASAYRAYVARGETMMGSRVRFQGAQLDAGGDGAAGAPPTEAEAPRPDEAARDVPEEADRPQATQTPAQTEVARDAPQEDTPSSGADGDERVAETNVQVAGLDEPDIVKTDGSHFYYAPDRHRRPVPEPRDVVTDGPRGDGLRERPTREPPGTHVIDVDEPADPRALAEIDATGDLLRTGDRLLLLGDDELTAYDVSDPADPAEVWTRPLDDRVVTARERNGTVYLVTQSHTDPDRPCPLEPIGEDAAVPCGDVYRPAVQIDADTTYSAFALDAGDGDVRDSVSFVGTGRHSAVYMSHEGLYVTYTHRTDESALLGDFLTESFDRTPANVEDRIAELRSYDISPASRQREIQRAVENWLDGVDADERREIREAIAEEFATYRAERQRDLQRTGIVRVAVDGTDLSVAATGEVPGRPLNQFSLSAHEGTLRIATTVPRAGDADSENDLYTLDVDSLDETGRVTGMGEGQEVYAVRYVGDTAYVVTFRQVDPLHVVDLSNPADPVERGTLELPGFSSYLHPIDDDHVLGIGEEDGKVKTVLFDVSDPTDPTIADDHVYDERWSAVADSHHAFTIDRRHGVFFLPAGDAGHLVDYGNGTLSIEHTVETTAPAQRARYVGDHLYVFAGTEVAVVDQGTWERETTLDLANGD